MFDLFFPLGGGVFLQRLGHFLREGMKPSPAVGKCDQCMIIKDSIWSQQKVTNQLCDITLHVNYEFLFIQKQSYTFSTISASIYYTFSTVYSRY